MSLLKEKYSPLCADAADALMCWCYWTRIRTCSQTFLKQFARVKNMFWSTVLKLLTIVSKVFALVYQSAGISIYPTKTSSSLWSLFCFFFGWFHLYALVTSFQPRYIGDIFIIARNLQKNHLWEIPGKIKEIKMAEGLFLVGGSTVSCAEIAREKGRWWWW